MNPYKATAEEMKRQSEGPKRLAKTAASVGSAAIGASSFIPLLSRAAPFLSQYVPENLAIKGLSKISPKFGKFINEAVNGGYDFQQVKDFIGSQIKESESAQEPAKENRNIIEQYSPELNKFIMDEIKSGKTPIQAAAIAQLGHKGKNFEKVIDKIVKDHKTSWSSIIESIFGTGQTAQQQKSPGRQPFQGPGVNQQLASEAMQPLGSQPAQPLSADAQVAKQPGQANQALMQALQAAQAARQRRAQHG